MSAVAWLGASTLMGLALGPEGGGVLNHEVFLPFVLPCIVPQALCRRKIWPELRGVIGQAESSQKVLSFWSGRY